MCVFDVAIIFVFDVIITDYKKIMKLNKCILFTSRESILPSPNLHRDLPENIMCDQIIVCLRKNNLATRFYFNGDVFYIKPFCVELISFFFHL